MHTSKSHGFNGCGRTGSLRKMQGLGDQIEFDVSAGNECGATNVMDERTAHKPSSVFRLYRYCMYHRHP